MTEIKNQLFAGDTPDPVLFLEEKPDERSLDERLFIGDDLIALEHRWRPPKPVVVVKKEQKKTEPPRASAPGPAQHPKPKPNKDGGGCVIN